MRSRQQQAARRGERDSQDEAGSADLRNQDLDTETCAVLDEIDCCLADAEAEQEAAEARERARAQAEFEAIRSACDGSCPYTGAVRCPHRAQMRVWMAAYAHLFFWCCGEPIFSESAHKRFKADGAQLGPK